MRNIDPEGGWKGCSLYPRNIVRKGGGFSVVPNNIRRERVYVALMNIIGGRGELLLSPSNIIVEEERLCCPYEHHRRVGGVSNIPCEHRR